MIDVVRAMEAVVEAAVAGRRPDTPERRSCTFGAAIVWRAFDRAASGGADLRCAAEAGLRAASGYLQLASELGQIAGQPGEVEQCAARVVAELQSCLDVASGHSLSPLLAATRHQG